MVRFLPKLFFPIFVPFTLWSWVMIGYSMFTDHTPSRGTGPSYSSMMDFAAICLAVFVAAILQVTLGLLSLRLLRRASKLKTFVICGGLLGMVMALISSWAFAVPGFGETMFTRLPLFLLLFVPSLTVGYALAHWADSHLPLPSDR